MSYKVYNQEGLECPHNDRRVGITYSDHPKPKNDSVLFGYTKSASGFRFDGWAEVDNWQELANDDTEYLDVYRAGKSVKIQAEIRSKGTGPSKSVMQSQINTMQALFNKFSTGEITEDEYREQFEALKG